MKKILLVLSILSGVVSCNDENAPDCLKSTGEIKIYNIDLETFSSIDVHNNIHVTVEQGATQSVTLTTGSNMFNSITFEILDGDLVIKDFNKCDWARPYGNLNVHIITPTLTKIRSSGGGTISSKGIISFPNQLSLIAELYTADFFLEVDLASLRIVNNDLANYYISGTVVDLDVGFYAGDGRFEGSDLTVENARLFQRGTNDMVVNATNSITGEIRSTGNIIYCVVPSLLDVEIIDDRGEVINACE